MFEEPLLLAGLLFLRDEAQSGRLALRHAECRRRLAFGLVVVVAQVLGLGRWPAATAASSSAGVCHQSEALSEVLDTRRCSRHSLLLEHGIRQNTEYVSIFMNVMRLE